MWQYRDQTTPFTATFTTPLVQHLTNICGILNKCRLYERFECLGHICCVYFYLAFHPDVLVPISVAVFSTVDDFLECCSKFWLYLLWSAFYTFILLLVFLNCCFFKAWH